MSSIQGLSLFSLSHTHREKVSKRHRGTRRRIPLCVSHLSPVSVINWTHLAFPPRPPATVCACQQRLSAFAQSVIRATFFYLFFHQRKKTWILCKGVSLNLKRCKHLPLHYWDYTYTCIWSYREEREEISGRLFLSWEMLHGCSLPNHLFSSG